MPLLRFTKVCKRYADRVILDQISVDIPAGERVALMGPSGSGKTTLLNCAGGIDTPDSGDISFQGNPIHLMDEEALARLRRESIGSVFQFFHLLPHLTAAENVELPLQLLKKPRAEREATVRELLESVGVSHRADAFPAKLSGGEQQRIAIARSLAARPQLILADEPTGNLDSATGERILDLLEALSNQFGFSLLMVTHAPESTRICHRTIHLLDGRIT